jgi:creatinine amidohydrolase
MASEILGSIADAGFRRFIVLNSHGGNISALDVVLTMCRVKYPQTRMVGVTYWNAAAEQLQLLRDSAKGGMGHACELETSLVLALRPSLVRTDLLQPDGRWSISRFLSKDMLEGGSAGVFRSFSEISANGGVGDPRTASAEKGKKFLSAIVTQLSELVRDLDSGRIDEFHVVGE